MLPFEEVKKRLEHMSDLALQIKEAREKLEKMEVELARNLDQMESQFQEELDPLKKLVKERLGETRSRRESEEDKEMESEERHAEEHRGGSHE